MTQENADKFPIPIRRHDEQSQTRVTWCEWKDFIPHLISFLVDVVKDLDFRRITLKCENGPSMKSISRIDESPHGERIEETIQKSQDFGGMQHQCEDHR